MKMFDLYEAETKDGHRVSGYPYVKSVHLDHSTGAANIEYAMMPWLDVYPYYNNEYDEDERVIDLRAESVDVKRDSIRKICDESETLFRYLIDAVSFRYAKKKYDSVDSLHRVIVALENWDVDVEGSFEFGDFCAVCSKNISYKGKYYIWEYLIHRFGDYCNMELSDAYQIKSCLDFLKKFDYIHKIKIINV